MKNQTRQKRIGIGLMIVGLSLIGLVIVAHANVAKPQVPDPKQGEQIFTTKSGHWYTRLWDTDTSATIQHTPLCPRCTADSIATAKAREGE